MTEDTANLCGLLTEIKLTMSYAEICSCIRVKLKIGQMGMKLATFLSGDKRKAALTTIYAEGITAEMFSATIDSLMLDDTAENRKANLAACPDHYVLRSCGRTLEVIENNRKYTGADSVFITFNDETD